MLTGADVRLGVDIGAERVKAVVAWPGGPVTVLRFGDAAYLDAGVFVEDDGTVIAGPQSQVRAAATPARFVARPLQESASGPVVVGSTPVPWVDVLAAQLRVVAGEATRVAGCRPGVVRVAVPAGWGPRRRSLVRAAASRAGFDEPELLPAPVAVADYLEAGGAQVPVGARLALCDFGSGFTVTVLYRAAHGFEMLATMQAQQSGGAALDAALAEYLAEVRHTVAPQTVAQSTAVPDRGPSPAAARTLPLEALNAARVVKEALSSAPQVAAAVVAMPVVVSAARWQQLARPVLDGAAATTAQALEAADTAPEQLLWLCTVGGGARMPLVAEVLRDRVGVQPVRVAEADHAAALGAARIATAGTSAALASSPPGGALERAGWVDTVGVLAAAVLSIALFGQFMAGSERYGPRQSIEPGMLLANWGGLALASIAALLAAVAGGLVVTAERHADAEGRGVRRRHRLLGAALAGGGVGGLVVAAAYATVAAGVFDLEGGPFLRWAVLPVLPPAAMVIAVGAVVIWRPEPPGSGWLAWLRFPTVVVVLIGVGGLLVGYDVTGSPSVFNVAVWPLRQWLTEASPGIISPVGRLGAACLGVSVGLLLVRRWTHRVLAAVPLGSLAAYALSWRSTGILAVGVAIAVAGWWLWRALVPTLRPVFLDEDPGRRAAGLREMERWADQPPTPVQRAADWHIGAPPDTAAPATAPHADAQAPMQAGDRWIVS